MTRLSLQQRLFIYLVLAIGPLVFATLVGGSYAFLGVILYIVSISIIELVSRPRQIAVSYTPLVMVRYFIHLILMIVILIMSFLMSFLILILTIPFLIIYIPFLNLLVRSWYICDLNNKYFNKSFWINITGITLFLMFSIFEYTNPITKSGLYIPVLTFSGLLLFAILSLISFLVFRKGYKESKI